MLLVYNKLGGYENKGFIWGFVKKNVFLNVVKRDKCY